MPQGNSRVAPLERAAMAELIAAVSSVEPLPVAPKEVTLTIVPPPGVVAPVPDRAIVAGELVALLATLTLPVTLPELVGANVTFNVAD